jgi:hypothetical protein
MDFGDFELSEAGGTNWVQLQVDGAPLFWDGNSITTNETKKPCRVELLSAGSNEVYEAFQKYTVADNAQKHRIARAKDGEIDAIEAKHVEKMERILDDLIVAAVKSWENVLVNGSAECTPSNIRLLIDRKGSRAKRQIRMQLFTSISEERANLGNAAQD